MALNDALIGLLVFTMAARLYVYHVGPPVPVGTSVGRAKHHEQIRSRQIRARIK